MKLFFENGLAHSVPNGQVLDGLKDVRLHDVQ